MRVAINGFGRIGRCVARALFDKKSKDLELVAINDIGSFETILHLFKYDSVHGKFDGTVMLENTEAKISTSDYTAHVHMFNEQDPINLPWRNLAVDVVLECSGAFTNYDASYEHIKAGAKRVLISAPAKNVKKTVVFGVNHYDIHANDLVLSNASCTTNCLAPLAYVLHKNWKIEKGFMTTVHSYTPDQKLHDSPHKDLRRARAAGLSMVPTSTGAAKSIGLVIPELSDKLDGVAVRVPTANVSLLDLTVELQNKTSINEINEKFLEASAKSMKNIIEYSEEPLVSIDYNHNAHSACFIPDQTVVLGGNLCKIMAWYDNEWGFSNRMLDVACRL